MAWLTDREMEELETGELAHLRLVLLRKAARAEAIIFERARKLANEAMSQVLSASTDVPGKPPTQKIHVGAGIKSAEIVKGMG